MDDSKIKIEIALMVNHKSKQAVAAFMFDTMSVSKLKRDGFVIAEVKTVEFNLPKEC